jgi:hypothetical protein
MALELGAYKIWFFLNADCFSPNQHADKPIRGRRTYSLLMAAYATRNGPYSRTNKLKPNRPPKKLIFYSLHRSIGRFATIGLHNISQRVLI